jgi:NADPH-dependent F420 reductase
MKIAIIGGTGNLGYGLALRFAQAGHQVLIGSRTAEKAAQAASDANAILGCRLIQGLENGLAAQESHLVVMAVPMEAQEATLDAIRAAVAEKVVVETTVPLASGDPTWTAMPPEGSAAERAQRLLPTAKVVGAFHHVGAKSLLKLEKPVETDVLVCGDDAAAKEVVIGLMEALGTRGIDVGPLRQAQVLERITPLLIGCNMRFKKRHTGIRLTGL